MLAGVNTTDSREAWVSIAGRSIVYENNSNGNPTKATYYEGENVVFIKLYTYDSNGFITKIECVNNID